MGIFRLLKDGRTKRLEKLIDLLISGDDEVQAEMVVRFKHASESFCEGLGDIKNFTDMKFALRPDQCDAAADKTVKIQDHIHGLTPDFAVDEMVFFLLEASLRHKAGHKWVLDKHAKLIDAVVFASEGLSGN